MAVRLDRQAWGLLSELRIRPTPFRIRGLAGATTVVDSRSVALVWEPRRVTPVYAVPRRDIRVPVREAGAPRGLTPAEERRPVLDPSVPFTAHTTGGTVLELSTPGGPVAAFAVADADLADLVLVDFGALSWREEEREVVAHPRDPAQRIEVRPTDAHLVLRSDGVPVVDTRRARLLWETMLPVRWYVPPEDVLVPLEPSGTVTWCAYKGRATYWSAIVGDRRLEDVVWTYEQPLEDGRDVLGLLGIYAERLDAVVDGEPVSLQGMPGE